MKVTKDILVVFLLGFLLYANTLSHQYVLDDKIVITENEFTKQGFAGIPDILTTDVFVGFYGTDKNLVTGKRYRPLSLVTFAIEYELFGKSPFVSHLINVLLYAFTGVLVYLLFLKILPDRNKNTTYWTTAFLSTAFFVTHPLHTEVVANIKGRDEILTLLGALGSLMYTLKWLETKRLIHLGWASLLLFLGLFAKENAITFLFVIPVTVYFFTSHSLKDNLQSLSPLLLVTALYLFIRFSLLGIPDAKDATELMNNPFIHATAAEKFATIFYTFGKYAMLLVWPHPLTHDYYPFQIPIINWADIRAITSLLLYSAIAFFGLLGFKYKKPTFYGFLFFLATFSIVSNMVFPIGSFMNERFMYIPSIGFAIACGVGVSHGLYKHLKPNAKFKPLIRGLTIIVLCAFSLKTVSRNFAWKNDLTLSTTDVIVSSNSAKANMSAGLSLLTKAQKPGSGDRRENLNMAISYLYKSLELYPTYIQPMLLMGNAYFELEDYNNSLLFFENCLKIQPGYSFAVNNIEHVGDVCAKNGNSNLAIKAYTLLSVHTPQNFKIFLKLGQVYGKDLGDNETALKYFLEANKLQPNNVEVLNKLGIVYSMTGRNNEAIEAFNKVIEQQPENASTLLNIGITYTNMGLPELAEPFIQKAISIDPKLKR